MPARKALASHGESEASSQDGCGQGLCCKGRKGLRRRRDPWSRERARATILGMQESASAEELEDRVRRWDLPRWRLELAAFLGQEGAKAAVLAQLAREDGELSEEDARSFFSMDLVSWMVAVPG